MALDYELELAAVIGADGAIEGFTIMNDWSARDLQLKEMPVGLGPAKGKDFATSLGPELVSPEELPADLEMRAIARVNGEVRTDSSTRGMHWSWEQVLEPLPATHPAFSPATCSAPAPSGGGCILEHGDGRWLEPGDEVELEIEGIGVLRNVVGG